MGFPYVFKVEFVYPNKNTTWVNEMLCTLSAHIGVTLKRAAWAVPLKKTSIY